MFFLLCLENAVLSKQTNSYLSPLLLRSHVIKEESLNVDLVALLTELNFSEHVDGLPEALTKLQPENKIDEEVQGRRTFL